MKYTLFILCLFIKYNIYGQIIKGRVVDAKGEPIEQAYVFNGSTNEHTHTDEFGKFTLKKSSINQVLNFSAPGFKAVSRIIKEINLEVRLESQYFSLNEVHIDHSINSGKINAKVDLEVNPVNSSQEILRKVPGLFIGQHAGGGKAEQIFLRGFDIDHGTDIAIAVDGMPVNMVSHAHGQGYADLHFVIPETVDNIDFGKGSFYAKKGDFNTAGYVDFKTKNKLDASSISVELGQFNTFRTVGLFDVLGNKKNQSAYIATEYILTDGPFDSPQNFNRLNLFGKYSATFDNKSTITIIGSHFKSRWDASGQIPQRLVNAGIISRFGAVDDTEGGATSRSNLAFSHVMPLSESASIKTNAYYSNYNFELYSNFTFFLEDPINGDQIKQKENRNLFGFNTEYTNKLNYSNFDFKYQIGIGLRADETSNSELSHTSNRSELLESIQYGDVNQNNIFTYLNTEFQLGKWIINPALRLDYFKFNYKDKLAPTYTNTSATTTKLSPKLNFIYNQSANWQLYLKSGLGFHSNDARSITQNYVTKNLPTAYSADFGTIFKITPRLIVNSALWYLGLEQEFVYVGDAGIVEPSGKTKRLGADFGLRYQLTDYLFFDLDQTYTYARSTEAPRGENYIPLAPDFTTTAGVNVQKWKGISGGLRFRYLDTRPANEDNTITAKGYGIFDANVNYDFRKFNFGITVENLLNVAWNETQFATETRLQNEQNSVDEIHFTPGTPFFLKARVTYKF